MEDFEDFILPEEAWGHDPLLPLKEEAPKHEPDGQVYPCGIYKFDRALEGGFREEDLVLISAQSSHGKTTMAQTLTLNYAKKSIPSLWLSYEMSPYYLQWKFDRMGSKDAQILVPVAKKGKTLPSSIKDITYFIEKASEIHGCKTIFIDHLDRLISRESTRERNRWDEQAFLVADLKKLAIEQKVIIFLLHQMRKIQHGTVLDQSAIKGSQNVVSECDFVILMERKRADQKKGLSAMQEKLESREKYSNITEVWIEKNRPFGKTPSVDMTIKDDKFVETKNYERDKI